MNCAASNETVVVVIPTCCRLNSTIWAIADAGASPLLIARLVSNFSLPEDFKSCLARSGSKW